MSTKIEDFIKENKKEFDTDMPSASLWDKLEKELDKKQEQDSKNKIRPFNIQLWAGIAASFLVLLGISLVYIKPFKSHKISVEDVSPVYAEKQVKFCGLIEQKRDSLETFASANPELYKKFSADLGKLNATYEELKKDLPRSPNQQMIVTAMIKNLEIQLQLLNQQLSIISDVNQYKKENSI